MLWQLDDWETEWVDNNWTPEQLRDFVLENIAERHLKITEFVV